jgi:hypothetical protein
VLVTNKHVLEGCCKAEIVLTTAAAGAVKNVFGMPDGATRILTGGASVPLNSRKAEKEAQETITVMGQPGQAATDVFNRVVAACQSLGDVSADARPID